MIFLKKSLAHGPRRTGLNIIVQAHFLSAILYNYHIWHDKKNNAIKKKDRCSDLF